MLKHLFYKDPEYGIFESGEVFNTDPPFCSYTPRRVIKIEYLRNFPNKRPPTMTIGGSIFRVYPNPTGGSLFNQIILNGCILKLTCLKFIRMFAHSPPRNWAIIVNTEYWILNIAYRNIKKKPVGVGKTNNRGLSFP